MEKPRGWRVLFFLSFWTIQPAWIGALVELGIEPFAAASVPLPSHRGGK